MSELSTAAPENDEFKAPQPTTEEEALPRAMPPSDPISETPPQSSERQPASRKSPLVPVIPNIPSLSRAKKPSSPDTAPVSTSADLSLEVEAVSQPAEEQGHKVESAPTTSAPTAEAAPAPMKVAPKSWADLVKSKNSAHAVVSGGAVVSNQQSNEFQHVKGSSIGDVLTTYDVHISQAEGKLAFLEPRGLVNTGNMCYMNSVSCCR